MLDYKKEDSSFYRAMHIGYPNAQDKGRAEAQGVSPGGFIMVMVSEMGLLGWLELRRTLIGSMVVSH